MIGLIARYHRKGEPDASELGDLREPGDTERLRLLCGVIRLAEQLERSRDRSIRAVEVSEGNGAVELRAATSRTGTRACRSGRRAAMRTCLPRRSGGGSRSRRSRRARASEGRPGC